MSDRPQLSFGATMTAARSGYPDRTAVVIGDQRLSFGELHDRAARVAAGLGRLGIRRGDPVAIWLDNCIEWMVTYWAVAGMGATLVPLNTRFRRREVAHCLGLTRAKAIVIGAGVASAPFPEILCEVAGTPRDGIFDSAELPDLRHGIAHMADTPEGFLEWSSLEDTGAVEEWEGRPEDVVFVQFTSGTTGLPKGVALRARMMLENAGQVGDRMLMDADTKVLFPGPLYHVLGAVLATLGPLGRGGCVVLTPSFDPEAALSLVERERCTVHFGLETMLIEQIHVQRGRGFRLDSLRTGMMAGSPALFDEVEETLHIPGLIMGFGMSETTASAATTIPSDPRDARRTTVGRPLDGCEIRIVDPDTGSRLGPGQQGEIRLRGTNIFDHYYNDPAATAAAFDEDGWFCSGDAGSFDEEGRLRFLGRMRETIRVGAENVSPVEVERLIADHPRVKMVQVVGVPDERLQYVPVAFVETVDGEPMDSDELIDWCHGQLASFKLPRHVVTLSEWPLTGTGRVQRQALRDSWAEAKPA